MIIGMVMTRMMIIRMMMIRTMVGRGHQSWSQCDGDDFDDGGSKITWWLMVTHCRALVTHPQNLEIVSEIIKNGVRWTKQSSLL